jgi:putative oxidoreductase
MAAKDMITKDKITNLYENLVSKLSLADGFAPLIMRLIVAPVMIVAGYTKLGLSNPEATFGERLLADPNVVAWFGNADWGLGLPFPDVLAFLAGWSEFLGGWFLVFGLLTRFVAIPLMVTMIVAATSVHWNNGWSAIASSDASTSSVQFFDWVGFDSAKASLDESAEVKERLEVIRSMVNDSRNPTWLKAKGNVVILNNGIEFSVIYFIMLLSLFFTGGGRFTSVDYWLKRTVFK